jgi:hypothetical protein
MGTLMASGPGHMAGGRGPQRLRFGHGLRTRQPRLPRRTAARWDDVKRLLAAGDEDAE